MKLVRLRRRLVASAMGAGLMLAASAGVASAHSAVHHLTADSTAVSQSTPSTSQQAATYHTDELTWS
jgi:hypothetical protein